MKMTFSKHINISPDAVFCKGVVKARAISETLVLMLYTWIEYTMDGIIYILMTIV